MDGRCHRLAKRTEYLNACALAFPRSCIYPPKGPKALQLINMSPDGTHGGHAFRRRRSCMIGMVTFC